jgi:hypothetical protein
MTYNKSGATITIENYYAMDGIGSLYWPPDALNSGTGQVNFIWSNRNLTDAYQVVYPVAFRHAVATVHESVSRIATVSVTASSIIVSTRTHAGVTVDSRVTLRAW